MWSFAAVLFLLLSLVLAMRAKKKEGWKNQQNGVLCLVHGAR
jgi:hypothetical protein